jgi:hypothetical protein
VAVLRKQTPMLLGEFRETVGRLLLSDWSTSRLGASDSQVAEASYLIREALLTEQIKAIVHYRVKAEPKLRLPTLSDQKLNALSITVASVPPKGRPMKLGVTTTQFDLGMRKQLQVSSMAWREDSLFKTIDWTTSKVKIPSKYIIAWLKFKTDLSEKLRR